MDEVERLLDAEQAANDLLATLSQLKDEMEGYTSAKLSLDEAVRELQRFVEATRRVASAAAASVETLKTLGMPEVLERTGALRGVLEDLGGALQERSEVLSVDLAAQISSSMAALTTTAEALMRSAQSQSLARLEQLGEQSRAHADAGMSAMQLQLDAMQDGVQQTVASSLAHATEMQGANLAEFAAQQRKALADSAQMTRDDVTRKVASLASGQDATRKELSRLSRIVLIQAVVVGVLLVAAVVVFVWQFFF